MEQIERCGWRIPEWCMSTGIPVSSFYTLEGEREPRKAILGPRRVRIIESPRDYLMRISLLTEKEAA
jgi:predicted DNA-binding transcriptional regulator AlpA